MLIVTAEKQRFYTLLRSCRFQWSMDHRPLVFIRKKNF